MAENKYDNLFLSGPKPWYQTASGPVIAHLEDDYLKGAHQYHIHWVPVQPGAVPGMKSWDDMGHGPHTHKQPEVMVHVGMDPENPYDLGAEIEFYMGEEMEKHVITGSTLVYLPAEFVHGPWIIKKVERPFLVMTVCQEPEHTEKARPDIVPEEMRKKLMFIDQNYDSPERKVTVPEGLGEW